jgi:hypothetical protein
MAYAPTEYSVTIGKALRVLKSPVRGLIVDVVTHPDFLELRIYENQIMSYNITQREAVMQHLYVMKDIVEAYGVRCEFGGLPGDPPQPRRKK